MRDSVDVFHYADSSNKANLIKKVLIKKIAPEKSLGTFDRTFRILLCLL